MRSFSFKLKLPIHGEHYQVEVRFGVDGQRALLGTLTMNRQDWRALRECALGGGIDPDDLLDEVAIVPGRERCPGSFKPPLSWTEDEGSFTGRTGQCAACGGISVDVVREAGVDPGDRAVGAAHRRFILDGHPWPHRWKLP